MLNKLCMPALIYLIFSFTHVIVDTYKQLYNTAIIEVWISVVFTLLLNLLCQQNLGFISWLIISIPFLLMTVIASLILFVFKLNPATGQALSKPPQSQQPPPPQSPPQPPPQSPPPPPPPQSPPNPPPPTQSQQPPPQSPQPSRYSFPVTAFYGSLGNYKTPSTTR